MVIEDNFEMICAGLIANSGEAKSEYIEAIRLARKGELNEARKSWNAANESYQHAHELHLEMFSMEIEPGNHMEELLLIHAEDQMNSAETFKTISEEMIEMYKIVFSQKQSS